MFLSIIASAAVLWIRFLQSRARRRLLQSLKKTHPELFRDDGELRKPE